MTSTETTPTTPATNPSYSIVHTELSTSDYHNDREFLGNIFGWTFEDQPSEQPYAIITNNGQGVGGIRPITEEEPGPTTTSYVAVDDLGATTSQITENGGKVLVPETAVPGMGRFIWFQTPGGCVLAAWQDDPDAA